MQWSVNGPAQVYSTTGQACAWLGIGETRFRRYQEAHAWLRPYNSGTPKRPAWRWHWMDLVALAHILQQQERADGPVDLAAEGDEG